MAVDTSVLERRAPETLRNNVSFTLPTRSEYEAEDEHNARIKDNYAKLINPNNKIEDIFAQSGAEVAAAQTAQVEQPAQVQPVQAAQPMQTARPVQNVQTVQAEPYRVENARVDSALFRADNPINRRFVAPVVDEAEDEEENEDLRPTAATIQYRTIDRAESAPAAKQSERFALTKKQKITAIALVAVVVALIVLIIVNSTVIANLNADIANLNNDIANINTEIGYSITQINDKISKAQTGIDTLRGAAAGLNGTFADVFHGFIG